MQGIARFVMRNRFSGAAFILMCSLLPLFVWFGNAALALWTLRRGAIEGATVAGLALAGYILLGLVTGGSKEGALVFVLLLWLPLFVAAAVLRATVSLQWAIVLATAIAVAALGIWSFAVPNDGWAWSTLVGLDINSLTEAERQTITGATRFLPLVLGLSVWLNTVVGLLLGRYWQSVLYNPGGFGKEFRAFRAGGMIAVIVVGVWVAAVVTGSWELRQIAILIGAALVLQSLAVLHALARVRGWSWYVPALAYVTLPLSWPILMAVGGMDSMQNFRKRIPPEDDAG